jgi:ABC-type sugar transport system ATPase subunit
MTPVLTVKTLSKSFNGVRVLKDVSLTLKPGEIRALVGQNGCGK